ncbi:type II toxin-antitoxin system VapC family toxin [Wenzhouxiangella marina]|uniref:Ribonuclease VapC n=1 Tax=Wenzhouxiangella marina TaxID=1579979 RepID=A0A0K0XU46_9GAMM|nr:type II toxin-antitoxin system VapC family toxin [Wenzhouxiangella marina]AKS41156.1 Ribonuclease VapC [Wenzhouxiangella marina]MBB6088035.1 putative nucleic acid-binding protein [Wenzhouxiangella marina]
MKRVLDASVLVAALVDSGPAGQWAEQLLSSASLCGPQILPVETANILRRAELAGDLDATAASLAHHTLCALPMTLFDYEPLADRVWALRHNLTAYDANYVALAEALDCELATLDRRLAKASGPLCRFLLPPQEPLQDPGRA